MTDQDREPFARGMLLLGATFDEPVTDLRVAAYFDALRDLPWHTVNRAMREAIAGLRFFPKPVELRDLRYPPRYKSAGSLCPHEDECPTIAACIRRKLAEGRHALARVE